METPLGLNADVVKRIQQSRQELLDLSTKNSLINMSRGKSRGSKTIEVVDELSEEVFRILVRERKEMSFRSGKGETGGVEEDASPGLAQPGEETNDNGKPESRHLDLWLQTRLSSDRLQPRLLKVYFEAQKYEQEQGVEILYLAMGFLKWYESPSSDVARYGPLLLVPVNLERSSANSRFKLQYREEEITTNLSLQAKLRSEFDVSLPDIPDMDEFSPAAYFRLVAQAIEVKARWEVRPNEMILGFYSFAKFLMYRDLDPESWPRESPLCGDSSLTSLLEGRTFTGSPLCEETESIDSVVSPKNMVHVTDADSSQSLVIEEVRRGRDLVVQGPPGTGKSQTITNLIATAVKEGKEVLFVAEKMAALDVVHARLAHLGLGAICLELHSQKANNRVMLAELARTLDLGRPKVLGSKERHEALRAAIERLNRHAEVMNSPSGPSTLTPYQIIGRLRYLYDRGIEASSHGLAGADSWSVNQYREARREIEDFQAYVRGLGALGDHPWRGVNRSETILQHEVRAISDRMKEIVESLTAIIESDSVLTNLLGLRDREASGLKQVRRLVRFTFRLIKAPPLDRSRIAEAIWENQTTEIARFVTCGRALAESRYRAQWIGLERMRACFDRIGPPKEHPFRGVNRAETLVNEEMRGFKESLSEVLGGLRAVLEVSGQLEEILQLPVRPEPTLQGIQFLANFAKRILRAPRVDRAQICHPIWETRRERIAELVKQGAAYSATMSELQEQVADVAWQTDVSALRRQLAGYGKSSLRWLNRNYREAVATFKGIQKSAPPNALDERLKLLDAMVSAQAMARSLDDDQDFSQVGLDAFGTEWRGSRSDWAYLASIVDWDRDCLSSRFPFSHRETLQKLDQAERCRSRLDELTTRLQPAFTQLKSLLKMIHFDHGQALGFDSVLAIPLPILVARLVKWQSQPEELPNWIEYQAARHHLEQTGLGSVNAALHEEKITIQAALSGLEASFYEEMRKLLDEQKPVQMTANSLDREANAVSVTKEGLSQFGPIAFGSLWNGISSDWDALDEIVTWDRGCRDAKLAWDHRSHLARLDSLELLQTPYQKLVIQLNRIPERLSSFFKVVDLDIAEAFGAESDDLVPVHELLSRFHRWLGEQEQLSKWIGYQVRRRRFQNTCLTPLIDGIHEGRIPPDDLFHQFEEGYYQALIRDVFQRHPDLAEFDGQSQERWVEEFRKLDQARIMAAREEVASVHFDAIPSDSSSGEMGVIRREIEKKRRHLSIRKLLKEAGTAILAIKPVFMMSPISVAQFLEPGNLTFDLLLIDEASQVRPVDAFGAMARAKQIVVVGDQKQLPPSHDFSKSISSDDESSDEDFKASDLESILGLCVAQGIPQRMLRWHYRSRHHSLIELSNHEFYDNRLYVVPSPNEKSSELQGLHFRLIQDGIYERGGARVNRVEARAVANAVIEHARLYPKKSLGVGVFSLAQRDAIRDELELLQRKHGELAAFFAVVGPEPFFVKNLENIQGDERDVIFISVGYARDTSGYMAMNFGPLGNEGGERRLNVLITRAREQCVVFSSITSDDIDLERARSRGVACFKKYLRYAATGILDLPTPTGGDFDSDFERQVSDAIQSHGYVVHRQVGSAGFLIDLAVVDPSQPGRYLLGIECDGATYHSSRSARDRDRIREAVLRDRGWEIHRIWSTDWFHRPEEQVQKALAAIDQARRAENSNESLGPVPMESTQSIPLPESGIEREVVSEDRNDESGGAWVTPYVEAVLDVPSELPIHETGLDVLTRIVVGVVEVEGPIHREEIARRVTSLWGLQRTGARIAEAISKAIEQGILLGLLRSESDFVTYQDRTTILVRNRAEVASTALKKPEMISPSEIRQAILHLVSDHLGVGREELPLLVARAFGFKSTSSKIREMVIGVLEGMIQESSVVLRDHKLFIP